MIKRLLFLLLFICTSAFCRDPLTQLEKMMFTHCLITDGNNILYAGTEGGIYKHTYTLGGPLGGWHYEKLPNLDGRVDCIAKSGSRIFAGGQYLGSMNNCLWYTDDNGNHWSNTKVPVYRPVAILVEGSTVFVAGVWDGLYRSTSNGDHDTWEQVLPADYYYYGIWSIIKAGDFYYAGSNGRVWKSISGDFGTWTSHTSGLQSDFIGRALATEGTNIFAGGASSYDGDIYVSKNEGVDWSFISDNGMPRELFAIIALDGVVGVGGYGYFSAGGPDFNIWANISTGLPALDGKCFAHNDNSVFIGSDCGIAYKSRPLRTNMKAKGEVNSIESGDVWHPLVYSPTWWILPVNSNEVSAFATRPSGLIKFKRFDDSLDYAKCDSLGGHQGTSLMDCNGVLFAGTDSGGVYSSSDTGVTWKHTSFGLTDNSITSFTELGGVIYAGTASSGVFKCTVGDTVWSLDGLAGMKVLSLGNHTLSLFAGTKSGVYKKTIHEPGWNLTSLTDDSVVTFCEHDEMIFIGSGTGGPRFTTDNGTTWVAANTGLPTLNIRQLAAGGGNIYAATDSGVFRSSDHGSNWVAFNYGNTSKDIRSIAVDDKYVYAGNAFGSIWWDYLAGYWPSSAVASAGWNMISAPVNPVDPRKISLFPTAISPAWAYEGYYKSEDTIMPFKGYWLKFASAQSVSMTGYELTSGTIPVIDGWNMIGALSVPIPISSITSDPPGLVVSDFFGYNGDYYAVEYPQDTIMPMKGYWVKANGPGTLILSTTQSAEAIAKNAIRIVHTNELPPSPPDGSTATELAIPKEYALGQAYPNPFNPATTIKYELPKDSKVSLKVYNLLGQVVAVLVDEVQSASYKSIEWNAGAASSGIYFYKLEATSIAEPGKSFVQVKKMLLLK
jgi:hypothetical protein